MDTISDFVDLLDELRTHKAHYLIIGGLAFTYHAKPRYTKGMDLWLDPALPNVDRANRALAEFGSPYMLDEHNPSEILQLGVAPNRIDLIRSVEGPTFEAAWRCRVPGRYGNVPVNWVDLDTLIDIKRRIPHPRHQEDVRVLEEVKRRRG